MKIMPLKCPNCAGEIQLDIEREIGFCMYCGGKVVIQEQFNKPIKIDESEKIKNWITLGFDALSSGKSSEIEQYANKIIETDITNPAGWYLKGFTTDGNIQRSIECWVKAVTYSKNDVRIKELAENALNNPDRYVIRKQWTIQFVRQAHVAGYVYAAKVMLDNKEICQVKNGESKSIRLDEGNYTLKVKFGLTKQIIPIVVDKNILINMDIDKKTNSFKVTQTK